MTKEYFASKMQECLNDNWTDEMYNLVYEFFESNVCIPKGEQRHPYADVLHEWIEGAETEFAFKGSTTWLIYEWSDSMQYRIKPSEFTYPMWFKSIPYQAVVRFDNINTITYVEDSPIDASYKKDYFHTGVHPHTDSKYWVKVEEPSEPIYEWQWLVCPIFGGVNVLTRMMTDSEFNSATRSRGHNYTKLEETKRERK